MTRRWLPWLAVALVLGVTLALMWKPMRDETPTTDETVFIGAGYSYWRGHRYYLNPEHPPLMQLWSTVPLLFLDVKLPANAGTYFDGTTYAAVAVTWEYNPNPDEKFGPVPGPFYHYPAVEAQLFGRSILYDGQNDADRLVFWGRFMEALVMLATGVLVFLWAKSLSNIGGGLLALVVWCFNPLALAYGHLIITDPGVALMLPWAVWMLSRFLESPRPRTAIVAGLICGGALLTKYTAIILVPICAVLTILKWCQTRQQPSRRVFRYLCLVAAVTSGTVLLLYAPHWSPPPALSAEAAHRLLIPKWFVRLRWLLIPRDYFKGLTILLLHVTHGHESYLLGQWSEKGWWYYYPVAILVKTPLALLLLTVSAVLLTLHRVRQAKFAELVPLLAAVLYLGCAMTSRADIGIRHVLPIYPLLAVAAGVEFSRAQLPTRVVGCLLAAWLIVVAFVARTDYIAYFNEAVGGPAQGQNYLVDSNFDWGQNGRRLKHWMEKNHIGHVYLDYFGTGLAIDHLHISTERVKAAEVPRLTDGYLVVSATHLMLPAYDAFRATHKPIARIGYTLFVYALPASAGQPAR